MWASSGSSRLPGMSPRAAADEAPESPAGPAEERPAVDEPAGRPIGELPREVVIDDVQAIRALAHEARLAALDELFGTHRIYNATELAAVCRVSPSSMSYHLRALEKYGFIRRAEHDGDGRSRYWQAAAMMLRLSGFGSSAHAKHAYANVQIQSLQKRISVEINRREQHVERPATLYPIFSSGVLSLAPEKAEEFMRRLHELMEEYETTSERGGAGDDGDRRLHYFVSALEDHGLSEESGGSSSADGRAA